MKIGARGLELIRQFEGCHLTAYCDPVGIWTIGYGHTATATEGQTITQVRAEGLLAADLEDAEQAVNKLITAPLSQSMLDALVSWTFNLGRRRLSKSTMRKRINDRRYIEATGEMIRWYKTPGVEWGLRKRRLAEATLFMADPKP